jgi:hypothetical protein
LYWVFLLLSTNVTTFILSGGFARYKCEASTFVPSRATTVQMWGICTRWGGRDPDAPLWGHICTGWWLQPVQIPSFVLGAKILDTNENSAQGQMSDFVVVHPDEAFKAS